MPQYHAIRAWLPITAVEVIAALPDVQYIGQAARGVPNKINTSEGYIAHNAPRVDSRNFTGEGIKVGVLSDSVDYLDQVQATGDLPATVAVLPGQPGTPGSGEGTAMLEIVYDLAPSASLYFATADPSKENMASNIIALQKAGCQVIIDDYTYQDEAPFQDDVLCQAVNTVTASGVAYFSCGGNRGNLKAGTAGAWEGDYVDGGNVVGLTHVHAFAPGVTMNKIGQNLGVLSLWWSPLRLLFPNFFKPSIAGISLLLQ